MDAADSHYSPDNAPRTANIALRGLWTFSVVLIAAAIACGVTTASAYSTSMGTSGVVPYDYTLMYTVQVVTPGVITASLVCVGLALAVQAMVHREDRVVVVRDSVTATATQRELDAAPAPATPLEEPASAVPAPRLDPERFMRPRTGSESPGAEHHERYARNGERGDEIHQRSAPADAPHDVKHRGHTAL